MTTKHNIAGKTLKTTIYIARADYDSDSDRCSVFSFDPSKSDPTYVLLAKQLFEYTVPDDFDPTPQQVAALLAKKAEITAEFTKAVSDLNRQLSELQALPNEVEA